MFLARRKLQQQNPSYCNEQSSNYSFPKLFLSIYSLRQADYQFQAKYQQQLWKCVLYVSDSRKMLVFVMFGSILSTCYRLTIYRNMCFAFVRFHHSLLFC